jgi:hypothetical protein
MSSDDDLNFWLPPETPLLKATKEFLASTSDIGLGHITVNESKAGVTIIFLLGPLVYPQTVILFMHMSVRLLPPNC